MYSALREGRRIADGMERPPHEPHAYPIGLTRVLQHGTQRLEGLSGHLVHSPGVEDVAAEIVDSPQSRMICERQGYLSLTRCAESNS